MKKILVSLLLTAFIAAGTGFAQVDIDDVAHTMHIVAAFSGLTGTTTAAHIHAATLVAGAGTAGVATTTPSFALFPLGVTSGTFEATLDMTQASSYNPSYVADYGGTTAGAEAADIFAKRGFPPVVFEQNARPYGKVEDGLPRCHAGLRAKEYAAIDSRNFVSLTSPAR